MATTEAETRDVESREPHFILPVDECHRATVLKPWRFHRPHMRAFFFAWFSFFTAFFGWFAVPPLMKTIEKSEELGLTKTRKRVSNIVSVVGTIIMRLVIGPAADRYGPRWAQSFLLIVFSLPVYLIGTAQNYAMFVTARFFISFLGAAFVVTQYWTSIMFAKVVVGAANATSAGWGNFGGGVTQLLMPQFFNLMKVFGLDDNMAWRVVMVIPATMTLAAGILLFFFSDDCPDGNYSHLIRSGSKVKANPVQTMLRATLNVRSWILFLLYACCFGVELIMNLNLSEYFQDYFGLNQGTAGMAAFLFGLMNLFARSLGGIASDIGSKWKGMTGRLIVFFVVEFLSGCMLILFSRIRVLGGALPCLIAFSTCVQMSEGATFGVVPYVDPPATGAVSGIVGAGGNFGAVTLGLLFVTFEAPDASLYLGFIVIGVSFLVWALIWPFSITITEEAPLKIVTEEEENVADTTEEIAA